MWSGAFRKHEREKHVIISQTGRISRSALRFVIVRLVSPKVRGHSSQELGRAGTTFQEFTEL